MSTACINWCLETGSWHLTPASIDVFYMFQLMFYTCINWCIVPVHNDAWKRCQMILDTFSNWCLVHVPGDVCYPFLLLYMYQLVHGARTQWCLEKARNDTWYLFQLMPGACTKWCLLPILITINAWNMYYLNFYMCTWIINILFEIWSNLSATYNIILRNCLFNLLLNCERFRNDIAVSWW